MEFKKWGMIALLSVVLIGNACDDDDGYNNDNNDGNSSTYWNQSDKSFATTANESNEAEVQLGMLAASHGSSDSVKVFAQLMVDEHGDALQELKAIASEAKFDLSTALNAEHQQLKARLDTLAGLAFDSVYINAQVRDHMKAVVLFESEVQNGKSTKLISYTQKYLPHLRTHLKLAQNIGVFLHVGDTVTVPIGRGNR